jgi:hypothetical protein
LQNFQVRLPDRINELVDQLANDFETSKNNVVRSSIELLARVHNTVQNGGKLTLTDKDGNTSTVFLLL